MERVQVYLTEAQVKRLNELSTALGCSKAELVREGVDMVLRRRIRPQDDPLLELVGQAGPVGSPRLGSQHDLVLADWELGRGTAPRE